MPAGSKAFFSVWEREGEVGSHQTAASTMAQTEQSYMWSPYDSPRIKINEPGVPLKTETNGARWWLLDVPGSEKKLNFVMWSFLMYISDVTRRLVGRPTNEEGLRELLLTASEGIWAEQCQTTTARRIFGEWRWTTSEGNCWGDVSQTKINNIRGLLQRLCGGMKINKVGQLPSRY